MKYFWTLFWAWVLAQMLNYVTSSMNGSEFNFMAGNIMAIVFTIAIIIVAGIIPSNEEEKTSF